MKMMEQIKQLKEYQYSDGFYLWVSTLILLPLALYLRFVIGTSLILDKNYPDFLSTALLLGGIMVAWLSWKWYRGRFQVAGGLDLYIGIFLIISCLATAFSVNPSLSLEKLIGIFSYILLFYLLLDSRKNAHLWQGIINSLLITAALSSLAILISVTPYVKAYDLGIIEVLSDPLYALETLPRLPYSLLLHPSVTAGYLLLLIPLGIYELGKAKKIIWKLILGAGILVNLVVLLLTRSRGGFIGLVFIIAATILVYRMYLIEAIKKNKIIGIVALILLGGMGIVFISFLLGSRGFDLTAWSIQSRFQLWNAAFEIIRDRPLFGAGPGSFGQEYLRFRDPAFKARSFIHAHNQIIQITTELGLAGLASLGLISWAYIKNFISSKNTLQAYQKIAIISLSGLFGATITDAIFTSSMIVFLLIFYLVWMLPIHEQWQSGKASFQSFMITGMVIAVGIGAGWIAWKINPYYKALVESYRSNWQAASEQLEIALERDPQNPYYQYSLGYTTGEKACLLGGDFDTAISHYLISLASYPNWDIAHANLAGLYSQSGDYDQAAAQMEKAISAYPYQPFYNCLLGDYYFELRRFDDAIDLYSKCISESPQILDSNYWRDSDHKLSIQEQVIIKAKKLASESEGGLLLLAELYFYAGDDQSVIESALDSLENDPKDIKANQVFFTLMDRTGHLPEAEMQLKEAIQDNPGIHLYWFYQGKLALLSGELNQAEQAFTISSLRRITTDSLLALGNLSLRRGDPESAQEYYQRALAVDAYPSLDFSRHVAGRRPMNGLYVSCLPDQRTYGGYIEPFLISANNIKDDDCILSACLLNKLVEINPPYQEAGKLLDGLPCFKDFDPKNCQ